MNNKCIFEQKGSAGGKRLQLFLCRKAGGAAGISWMGEKLLGEGEILDILDIAIFSFLFIIVLSEFLRMIPNKRCEENRPLGAGERCPGRAGGPLDGAVLPLLIGKNGAGSGSADFPRLNGGLPAGNGGAR